MVFSILIANYNNGKYFQDCWQSLVNQTHADWEAIIVDDCSTDNSFDIICKITNGDPRAKIFKNESNQGCGFTKRRCAELATADVFGFLDPDDTLTANALELMRDEFKKNEDAVLIYSKHKVCDEFLVDTHMTYELKQIDSFDPLYFNGSGVISAFACFKKAAYLNTEGIDPYMLRAVDQDLYLKLYETGRVVALNEYLYNYRIHSNGISTGNQSSNISLAIYWQWFAINSAAKRRGVYVEKLFAGSFVQFKNYSKLKKDYDLILNSRSYKLAKKISNFINVFNSSKK
jgi:glycosyltransferase involved in cell wall biosynthesis